MVVSVDMCTVGGECEKEECGCVCSVRGGCVCRVRG